MLAPPRGRGARPGEEYTIFQTLACAWPLEPERLAAYMEKAMRERKVTTNWLSPDAAHEAGVQAYCRALYDTGRSSRTSSRWRGRSRAWAPRRRCA